MDSLKTLLNIVRNVFTRCMKHISIIVKERKLLFYEDKRLIYTSTAVIQTGAYPGICQGGGGWGVGETLLKIAFEGW